MTRGLRLRQICLVASHLEPVTSDIAAIMGLAVCYRDPNVGKYGLENALLPVGTTLLEVVAPIGNDTAAERFLTKTAGRGGYMAIFSCDDPDERRQNAERVGVRVTHLIDRPPYYGVQLHPRDCRAAFIEFNHTQASDNILGPYPPAGPEWQRSIRDDVTRKLVRVELRSPDPEGLAKHWGDILSVAPRTNPDGMPEINLVNGTLGFGHGPVDALSGLAFEVADAAAITQAAKAKGYSVSSHSIFIAGVDFRLEHDPEKWTPVFRKDHA
jgi:hypothetical protein